jgi:hypothetical protein
MSESVKQTHGGFNIAISLTYVMGLVCLGVFWSLKTLRKKLNYKAKMFTLNLPSRKVENKVPIYDVSMDEKHSSLNESSRALNKTNDLSDVSKFMKPEDEEQTGG